MAGRRKARERENREQEGGREGGRERESWSEVSKCVKV